MKLSVLKSSSALSLLVLGSLSGGATPVQAATNIDTAQPYYNSSGLGTTLNPHFTGGTLRIDQANATYGQTFTLNNASTNTIDDNGNTVTFTGNFGPDAAGVVPSLTLSDGVGGGLIKISGNWGTASAPMGTITNTTSFEVLSGGSITANTIFSSASANFTIDAGATVKSNLQPFLSQVTNNGTFSGQTLNAGTIVNNGTWSGSTTQTIDGGNSSNAAGATWTGSITGGVATNHGTWTGDIKADTFYNYGTLATPHIGKAANSFSAASVAYNYGTINGTGAFNIGVAVDGTLYTSGTINGRLDIANSGAKVVASGGAINGPITIDGYLTIANPILVGNQVNFANPVGLSITGTVTSTSTLYVDTYASFEVANGGAYSLAGDLTNLGVSKVESGGSLNAGSIGNYFIFAVDSGGTLTTSTITNPGTFYNRGTVNANLSLAGLTPVISAYNYGTWNGNAVISGPQGLRNLGAWNGSLDNASTVENVAGSTWTGSAMNATKGLIENWGTWTGTLNNAGSVVNLPGAVWNGNAVSTTPLSYILNEGTWTGAVTTAGTFINSHGTVNGLLSQAAGTTMNAGTLNGGALITGGSLTTENTINGGLTNAAVVNASGRINGAIGNSGNLFVAGDLTNDHSAVSNTGALVILGGSSFTGIGSLTNGGGAIVSIGNAVSSSTLSTGSLNNSGLLILQNGRTGDRVNVSGAFTGTAGSVLSLDVNLAPGVKQGDLVAAGSTAGTTTLSLQNVGASKGYFSTPLVLVSTAGAAGGTFVAAGDAQTQAVLASNGLVDYSLQRLGDGTGWGLVSTLNGAATSTIANHSALLVNTLDTALRPTTHDLLAPQAGEGWSGRVWVSAAHAGNRMKATTTSTDIYSAPVRSTTRLNADGMMAGAEALRSDASTLLQLGVVGGVSEARAEDESGYDTRITARTVGAYAMLSARHLVLGIQAYHDGLSIRPDLLISSGKINGHNDTVAVSLAAPFTSGIYTFEPYAVFRTSDVHIQPVTVPGDFGTLSVQDLSNHTSGGGVRFSATNIRNGVRFKPFVSAGMETVSGHGEHSIFTPQDGSPSVIMTTTGPGTYTTLDSGLDIQYPSGIQVYARVQGRFGAAVHGVSLSSGMQLRF